LAKVEKYIGFTVKPTYHIKIDIHFDTLLSYPNYSTNFKFNTDFRQVFMSLN